MRAVYHRFLMSVLADRLQGPTRARPPATERIQPRRSTMPYTAVQFIGYEIYTGPGHNPDRYVGLDSDRDDIAARIALMKEALTAAKASPPIATDPGVLKVFMAPEFYFRGKQGAYPIELLTGTGPNPDPLSLIGGLSALIADASWQDWLVVFGTAIAGSVNAARQTEVYNVSYVQKGGFRNETERLGKCVVIMKEFMSGIDFLAITAAGLTNTDVAHLAGVGPGTYALEQNNPGQAGGGGYNGGSIFLMDNITFGLEVCLDHDQRRLLRAWPARGDPFIQLQLVPSGGMTINTCAVATLGGGLIFNVDGLMNFGVGGGYGYHTDLRWVRRRLPGNADLLPLPAVGLIWVNQDRAALTQVFWLPPDNDLYNVAARTPNLIIYAPAVIPQPLLAQ